MAESLGEDVEMVEVQENKNDADVVNSLVKIVVTLGVRSFESNQLAGLLNELQRLSSEDSSVDSRSGGTKKKKRKPADVPLEPLPKKPKLTKDKKRKPADVPLEPPSKKPKLLPDFTKDKKQCADRCHWADRKSPFGPVRKNVCSCALKDVGGWGECAVERCKHDLLTLGGRKCLGPCHWQSDEVVSNWCSCKVDPYVDWRGNRRVLEDCKDKKLCSGNPEGPSKTSGCYTFAEYSWAVIVVVIAIVVVRQLAVPFFAKLNEVTQTTETVKKAVDCGNLPTILEKVDKLLVKYPPLVRERVANLFQTFETADAALTYLDNLPDLSYADRWDLADFVDRAAEVHLSCEGISEVTVEAVSSLANVVTDVYTWFNTCWAVELLSSPYAWFCSLLAAVSYVYFTSEKGFSTVLQRFAEIISEGGVVSGAISGAVGLTFAGPPGLLAGGFLGYMGVKSLRERFLQMLDILCNFGKRAGPRLKELKTSWSREDQDPNIQLSVDELCECESPCPKRWFLPSMCSVRPDNDCPWPPEKKIKCNPEKHTRAQANLKLGQARLALALKNSKECSTEKWGEESQQIARDRIPPGFHLGTVKGDGNCLYYAVLVATALAGLSPGKELLGQRNKGEGWGEPHMEKAQGALRQAVSLYLTSPDTKNLEQCPAIRAALSGLVQLMNEEVSSGAWGEASVAAFISCMYEINIHIYDDAEQNPGWQCHNFGYPESIHLYFYKASEGRGRNKNKNNHYGYLLKDEGAPNPCPPPPEQKVESASGAADTPSAPSTRALSGCQGVYEHFVGTLTVAGALFAVVVAALWTWETLEPYAPLWEDLFPPNYPCAYHTTKGGCQDELIRQKWGDPLKKGIPAWYRDWITKLEDTPTGGAPSRLHLVLQEQLPSVFAYLKDTFSWFSWFEATADGCRQLHSMGSIDMGRHEGRDTNFYNCCDVLGLGIAPRDRLGAPKSI